MPKVKPPRTPRGEDPQVTIGNQDKQIKLLTERVVRLDGQLCDANKRADDNADAGALWQKRADDLEQRLEVQRRELLDSIRETNYQRGYIARVKEEDRLRFGDLVPE